MLDFFNSQILPIKEKIYKLIWGNIRYNIWKEHQNYKSNYYSYYPKSIKDTKIYRKKNKTIIFISDGKFINTGIADKIRGIISLFQYAINNGFDFKIYWNYPFNLEDYLLPAEYNWTISEKEINYSKAYPIFIESHYKSFNISQLTESHFQLKVFNHLIKRNKATNYHVWSNAHWGNNEYNYLFHKLFRIHPRIKNALKALEQEERYISMCFRFRQLLGDFVDAAGGETLPLEEQQDYIKKSIQEIHNMFNKYKCKILITSDSNKFIDKIKNIPFTIIIPGIINHSAIKPKQINNKYLFDKEFIDLFMISRSKFIFLMHKDKMYYSGFPEAASFIGNTPLITIEY